MEAETLTDDGKKILISLLNKVLITEYELILSYPRMIDKLVNYDKIDDNMLNENLMRLGRESMKHLADGAKYVELLGGEPKYEVGTIERIEDIEELLKEQLEKEKEASSMYRQAILVTKKNARKVKVRGFFNMLIHVKDNKPIEINVTELLEYLNRELVEENNHVKIVQDSIAILQMYQNKMAR